MSTLTRIKIGAWIASPALNLLENGGRSVKLESRTMDVLAYLAAHAGEVVSVEDLLVNVWRGVVVSDSSAYHAIKQLRQALAGSGDDTCYIETIPKRGYRLIAPVTSLVPDAAVADSATARVALPSEIATHGAPARRPSRPWLAAVMLGLVLVIGVALSTTWFGDDDEVVASADGTEVDATRTFRFALPIEGLTGFAVSRDGRYLAYSAGPTLSTAVLHVRPLDALEARALPGTTGAWLPFWSPDGEEIGFLTEGRIKAIAVAGGAPRDLAGTPVGTVGSWSSDGVILFDSSTGIERVSATGGESVKVTKLDTEHGEVAHVMPAFLPDGRRFFFSSAFSGSGVYVGSLDSAERTQVLPFSGTAVYSSGHLLFNRGAALFAQQFDLQGLTLYGEPIRLADGLVTSADGVFSWFTVSDTGVLMYAVGAKMGPARPPEPSRLAWYDRNGQRFETIGEPGIYRGIELSPDGKRVAVHHHDDENRGNLWLHDLERRGTVTRLTFGPGHDLWPVWSPDGSRIIFTGVGFNLYEKLSNGVGDEKLVLDSLRVPFATDWSPDGGTVLVRHAPAVNADVSSLRLDVDRAPVSLLNTEFNESGATLSPDGRWLAYVSDESGRIELYVRSYPELADKVQVSTAGGVAARWSPDGRELFYLDIDRDILMSVQVRDGDGLLAFDEPRELFRADFARGDHLSELGIELPHMPYDVPPDGQRFLVNERVVSATATATATATAATDPASSLTATIVVVVNWLDEVVR